MSRTLGQQFIVENVVGAGGTTGSIRAMRAAPDGYTIELGQVGTHAAAVALYPNLAYRPDVDFAPIGIVVDQAVLIVARKDFPAKDLAEFSAFLKANSEKLNMAHAGVGSITHFTGLLFNSIVGANPTLVPFTGSAPAISALAIFAYLQSWTAFIWPLLVLNDQNLFPVQLGLAQFNSSVSVNYAVLSAGAVVAMSPTVIAFLILRRRIIEGVTLTGFK